MELSEEELGLKYQVHMNFLRLFFVPADRLGVSTVILRSAIKFRAESWCVPFSPLCHCFSLTHFSDIAFLMFDHFKKERKGYRRT